MKEAFDMVENIVEKRKNVGYQHFLIFQPCFQSAFSLGLLKARIIRKKGRSLSHDKTLDSSKLKAMGNNKCHN